MPTYDRTDEFLREWLRLSLEHQKQFMQAVRQFVIDVEAGRDIRSGAGIKRIHSIPGVWEFRWASDGQALFRYGTSPHPGDVHIIRLRIGTHSIYKPR